MPFENFFKKYMPKKTTDYDNVFKTMKSKHKRLFIPVINNVFGKDYPMDVVVWDIGHATIPMPRFSVIYIKRTEKTPKTTRIVFTFPGGQIVNYESANVILEELTKEYIVGKRLFPYIPFYIARYEKNILSENGIEGAVEDLEYFRNEMLRLHEAGELSDGELLDLMEFVNTIVTHITDGNHSEERLVNVMGGTVLETKSEKLIRQGISQGISQGMRQGEAKMLIEMGKEYGLDDSAILERMQKRIGLSEEQAAAYLEQYGKQPL